MLEVLNQDFIRTARAKGLTEGMVVIKHAMQGGLIPVVSFLGPAIAGLLAGSFVVETFFQKYQARRTKKSQIKLLFRFIQYIERQVVLFDAIEDAGFSYVNNMHGRGTLRNIKEEAQKKRLSNSLTNYIKRFKVRIVLTAHPTQFYPDNVLVIINELSNAIALDDLDRIQKLLIQLGKTPFYKKEKPTPFDEAVSLIWFLENVFYHSASTIYNYIADHIVDSEEFDNSIFDFGFWPGGDRDGNPFVTPEITLKKIALIFI